MGYDLVCLSDGKRIRGPENLTEKEYVYGNAVQKRSSQERCEGSRYRDRWHHAWRRRRGQENQPARKEGLLVQAECGQRSRGSTTVFECRLLWQSALSCRRGRALRR